MIDPYGKVNERIRAKRRARGRRDDEYDGLIRAASQELGAATEAALGIFFDIAERVGLRYLEEAARAGATRRFRWTPEAVRGVRLASSRELRRRLEDTRRERGPGGDRRRRPSTPPRGQPPRPPAPHKAPERPRQPPARPPRTKPTDDGEDRLE